MVKEAIEVLDGLIDGKNDQLASQLKEVKKALEAQGRLLNACKVFVLDRRIRAFLLENDTKALEQAEAAIKENES